MWEPGPPPLPLLKRARRPPPPTRGVSGRRRARRRRPGRPGAPTEAGAGRPSRYPRGRRPPPPHVSRQLLGAVGLGEGSDADVVVDLDARQLALHELGDLLAPPLGGD